MFDEGTRGSIVRKRSSHDLSAGCDQGSCVALGEGVSIAENRNLLVRGDEESHESDQGACGEVGGDGPRGTARPVNEVRGDDRSRHSPAGPECCRLAYANIALTRRNAAIVNPEIYEVLESDLCLPSFSPTLTAM